jgi:hypothetical protein
MGPSPKDERDRREPVTPTGKRLTDYDACSEAPEGKDHWFTSGPYCGGCGIVAESDVVAIEREQQDRIKAYVVDATDLETWERVEALMEHGQHD